MFFCLISPLKYGHRSLLSTKKQGICIKNKNYSKLDQKLTKIGFITTKIAVYYRKLTKILGNYSRVDTDFIWELYTS